MIPEDLEVNWRDLYILDFYDLLGTTIGNDVTKEDIMQDLGSALKPPSDWTEELIAEEIRLAVAASAAFAESAEKSGLAKTAD